MTTWKHTAYYLDFVGEWVKEVETNDIQAAAEAIARWQQAGHATKLESFAEVSNG